MKPARILLLLVALVAGGLAAFLATRGTPPETRTIETVEIREEARARVLVATRAVGLGQRLSASDVSWQDWPEGAVRPEYITSARDPEAPRDIAGAVARFEIFAGEPIREAKLVRSDQGYLSAVITPGMRAVSIGVTAESASGGYVVPNDRVDVVMTRTGSGAGISETVVSNVRILAIGARLGETGATGGGAEDPASQRFESATIATLELSPGQAEAVLNAGAGGRLALVLRSVADFAETPESRRGQSQPIKLIRYGQEARVSAAAGSPSDWAGGMAPAGAGGAPLQLPAPLDAAAPLPGAEMAPTPELR